MFHLQNITLLQPEDVIAPRLPGGSKALGQYVQTIRAALVSYYSSGESQGPRTLALAVGPGGRAQFWLGASSGAQAEELTALQKIAADVPAPTVLHGPVILALVYSVGATPTTQSQLQLPSEWQAVVSRANSSLSVDEIVAQLWTDAG